MAQLFPPIIENKLPAFTDKVKINFTLGLGIINDDFSGISIRINNTYTQKEIETVEIDKDDLLFINNTYLLSYNLSDTEKDLLKEGLYYGFQIALIDNSDEVGYYSQVGTARRIEAPALELEVSNDLQEFVGKCTFKNDEKVYSYCFNLYEGDKILDSSGEIIHNNSINDGPDLIKNVWSAGINYSQGFSYSIEYSIKTVNGFESNIIEEIEYLEAGSPNMPGILLKTEFNQEEGYNKIFLSGQNLSSTRNYTLSGNFLLLRASSKNDFLTWDKVLNFTLNKWKYCNQNKNIYKDYYLEAGVAYKYAIQAYGKNETNGKCFYSSKEYSIVNEVENHFEDCFLTDGEKQLKIRFNPKISNFKNTVLENKVDTIGSKYPYFSRNGAVGYKEFQISGLISLLADTNDEFKTGLEIDSFLVATTSLEGENFKKEREFKNLVLDWLTDGKPKVFKSAAEGSFIVRLMNVSLSPFDTVGRLIHTFTCTAYEIAEFNIENLKKYDFLQKSNLLTTEEQRIDVTSSSSKTINFNGALSLAVYGEPNIAFTYFEVGDTAGVEKTMPYFGEYVFSEKSLKAYPIKKIEFEDTVTDDNDIHVIYKDSLADFVGAKTIEVTNTKVEIPQLVYGLGISDNETKELVSTYNLLPSTESTSGTNIISSSYHGYYGRIFPKPLIRVLLGEDDKYYSVEDSSEITSWSEDNVYEIEAEKKYFAPTSTTTTPNFVRGHIDNSELYSIHNGKYFLVDRLDKKDVYIAKDFNELYLGKGLKGRLYVSEVTTTFNNSGGNDIYAI